MHQLMEAYKGKVRLIYKYYPLVKIHPNAMSSAHAADCASLQDRFWPYHDRLFETQMAWAPLLDPTTSYMAIGEETKLDMARFKACYADPSRVAVIEQDAREAQARQVTATPTFIIGDDRVVGMVLASDGARTIEKALRQ
jgi:protein-disulfide isomerase